MIGNSSRPGNDERSEASRSHLAGERSEEELSQIIRRSLAIALRFPPRGTQTREREQALHRSMSWQT